MEPLKPLTEIEGVPPEVISRIQKLLKQAAKGDSLRADNNSQAEAELCIKKANELLLQWNLDESAVEAAGDPTVEKRVNEVDDKRPAMYKYQKTLWGAIAQVNLCLHWVIPIYNDVAIPSPKLMAKGWTPDEWEERYQEKMPTTVISKIVTKRHQLVGRKSNVVATKMMGDYLEAAINRVCPYTGNKTNSKDAISWKEGCAEKIAHRLLIRMWELRDKANQELKVSAAAGALILLNDVYLSEYEKNIDEEFGAGTAASMKAVREEKKRKEERYEMAVDCPQAFTPEEYREAVNHFAKKRRQSETKSRRQTAEYSERNMSAWFAGRKAGEDISLDPQVGEKEKPRQLR